MPEPCRSPPGSLSQAPPPGGAFWYSSSLARSLRLRTLGDTREQLSGSGQNAPLPCLPRFACPGRWREVAVLSVALLRSGVR